jgi:hypothetical protein
MKEKNVAWILIGVAIIIGALRLLDVIDNSITAVFMMLAFIMVTGALMGARKKREKEKAAEEAASQQTEKEV